MSLKNRRGIWHYRFYLGGQEYAETTRLEATRGNREAALRIEAEARLKAERSYLIRKSGNMAFDDGASLFGEQLETDSFERKPRSIKRIKASLRALTLFFKDEIISQISPDRIEAYKRERLKKPTYHNRRTGKRRTLSLCSLASELNGLSLFFEFSKIKGWRTDNPLKGPDKKVKRPSIGLTGSDNDSAWHVVTPAEEQAYFALAKEEHRDIGRLILNQGLRPDEIFQLAKRDFDPVENTIYVRFSKTKAGKRTLYLVDESRAIFIERCQEPGDYFFQTDDRDLGYTRLLIRPHRYIMDKTGFAFRPYDFRHTFATRMLMNARTDIFTLSKIMGHANTRMLEKYVHPTPQNQRDAMTAYGESMAQNRPIRAKAG